MTWTTEDAAAAAQQGWGVFTVIDVTGGRVGAPAFSFLPVGAFTERVPSAPRMRAIIQGNAMNGDALCKRACKHLKENNP